MVSAEDLWIGRQRAEDDWTDHFDAAEAVLVVRHIASQFTVAAMTAMLGPAATHQLLTSAGYTRVYS